MPAFIATLYHYSLYTDKEVTQVHRQTTGDLGKKVARETPARATPEINRLGDQFPVSLAGVIADEVARSENLAFHRRDDRVAIRIRRVEVELRVQREDLEVVWMRFARRRLRSDIARLACWLPNSNPASGAMPRASVVVAILISYMTQWTIGSFPSTPASSASTT
jgi:hypothetical protein